MSQDSTLPALVAAKPTAISRASSVAGSKRFYLPELDSLRFFAFLAVFICHAFPHAPSDYSKAIPDVAVHWISGSVRAGAFGVDLFFMLSSFLITALLQGEHRRTGGIDVLSFWIRRCLRIWPLYFTFVLLAGILPYFFHFIPQLAPKYLWGLMTFTHNWVLSFCGVGNGNPSLIMWSVSLEEQFYLIWPVLIALAGIKRLAPICVGLIFFSVIARVLVH